MTAAFRTPGDPLGPDRGGLFDEASAETADWMQRVLPPDAIRLVPEDVEIIGRLGDWLVFDRRRGGMGEVFLCVAEGSRVAMALKSYAPALLFDAAARRAFQRECAIGILASSAAFGILPYGFDVVDGRPFIVMPAVLPGTRGEVNLRDLLRHGPLPLAEAIYVGRVIANALDEARHYVPGLVHGDLKPENILMLYGVPHVADFGLARFVARQLGGDALAGTPQYRSPEADDPCAVLTVAADVYSYGVMLAEMLTGHAPGRDDPVHAAGGDLDDPVARPLLDLAGRCCLFDPAARPADFAAVSAALEQIAPEADWPLPTVAAALRNDWPFVIALQRSIMSRDLLKLGEYDMVLDFIAATDADNRGWRLWVDQGIALSLTGREGEALASYQAALGVLGAEDAESAWQVLIAQAESLNRLRQYEAAENLLETLITNAPDDFWAARAALNLAVLWVDTKRYDEAKHLLGEVLAASPDNAIAWVNRAVLHQRVGDPVMAADMLRRAIAAEPAKAEWHERLGWLLMDELGLLEDAGVALRDALGCGSLGNEVFTRALACALAVGDQANWDDLLERIAAEYGTEAADGAKWNANVWAFWLVRKYGGPDGPAGGDLPDDIVAGFGAIGLSDPLADGALDQPAEDQPDQLTDDQPTPEPVPVQGQSSGADDHWPQLAHAPGAETADSEPGGAFRHLQLMLAVTGLVYIDVYQPFDDPDFTDTVLRQRRRAWIGAARVVGQLAQTPFYLLRCPECSVELASNRPPGSSLCCQRCQATYPVTPLREPAAEALMSGLGEALGIPSQAMDGWEMLVVVQLVPTAPFPAPTQDTVRELAALLEQRGIELLPSIHSGVLLTLSRGIAGGALRIDQPWIGGRWQYPPGSIGSGSRAPEQVLSIFDEARRLLLPTRLSSITLSYDANSGDPLLLLYRGRPDELEDLLRARQPDKADATVWLALATLAQLNGDVERAFSHAQAAVEADQEHAPAWAILASLRLATGDANGAVAAAEHALRLDPAQRQACEVLAVGFSQQGRDSEARQMAARSRTYRRPAHSEFMP